MTYVPSRPDPSPQPPPAAFRPVARGGVGVLVVLAVCTAVFVGMMWDGWARDPLTIMRWGALIWKPTFYVAQSPEWWRLGSSIFLHAAWWHLAMNGMALLVVGPPVEARLGLGRWFLVFSGAGLGGSLAAVWMTPNIPGVGASGAIFGVMVAAVLVSAELEGVPWWRSRNWFVVFLGLLPGFLLPDMVSNAAHIGGAVTGGVLAAALLRTRDKVTPILGYAAFAGLLACMALAVRHALML